MKTNNLLLSVILLFTHFNIFAQSNCNYQVEINPVFTSLGSPLDGPYQPGEGVQFCLEITTFNPDNCNLLHGIVPDFGEGWDPSSFYSTGEPNTITSPLLPHTNGNWAWYPDNWVTYKTSSSAKELNPGDFVGAGWFFQNFGPNSTNPFDPNFTRGDGVNCDLNTNTWQVCFYLIAKDLYDCQAVVDCSVNFLTFGDGETGSNPTPGCFDDPPVTHYAELDCCDASVINPIADMIICNGETIVVPLTSDGGPNTIYTWEVDPFNVDGAIDDSGNVIFQTLSSINTGYPSSVVYTVSPILNGCVGPTESFTVTISNVNVDLGADINICPGETVRLGEFPASGVSPFTYHWEHGPTNYRPLVSPTSTTTYYITVTDALGCSTEEEVTVFVGQAGPIVGPTDLCGINSGSYSVQPFPGATSYTWTVPSDAIILSGQGTTAIVVDWSNSSGGELCVRPNNGCSSGMTFNCVEVSAGGNLSIGSIQGNLNPCINTTETYFVSTSDPGANYLWSVTEGEILSGQGTNVIQVNWFGQGFPGATGFINLFASNACANGQSSVEVNIGNGTLLNIDGPEVVCPNEIVNFSTLINPDLPNQIEWTVPSGAAIITGQGSSEIFVDWGAAQSGIIAVVVHDGCAVTATTHSVEVYLQEPISIEGPAEACPGDILNFSLSSDLPADANILWSFSSNFIPSSNPVFPMMSGTWANDSDGEISVEVSSCDGMIMVDTVYISAFSGSVIDTTFEICEGSCVEYLGVTFCDEGSFSIVNSGSGICGETHNIHLSFLANPDVLSDAGIDTNVGCTVTTILDGSSSSYPSGSEIRWEDSDGMLMGNDITLEVSEPDIYTLYIFNPISLCSDSDDVEVFPAAPPIADAGPDKWINCFSNFQVQLDALNNANWTYNWTGPNGFSSSEARPTVTIAGIYLLEVVDLTTGCGSATDEVTVFEGYTLSTSTTQSICDDFDGTATVHQEGIENPEYSWSNGATDSFVEDLAPGNYSVSINTAVGSCTEVLDVVITADLSCKVTIAGNVFDDGASGDCDPDDPLLIAAPDIPVTLQPLGLTVLTNSNGYYEFIVDTGSYVLTAEVPTPYFVLCPGFQTLPITLSDTADVSTDNHFFLDYLTNFDLRVNGQYLGGTPGQNQNFEVAYCNDFFQTINGQIDLIHDPQVTFDPVENEADFYDPDTYTASWLFAGLSFFECEYFNFSVDYLPNVPHGTPLEYTLVARPILGDIQPNNNTATISTTVNNPTNNDFYFGNHNGQQVPLNNSVSLYPNPARNQFTISSESGNSIYSLNLLDIMGRDIYSKKYSDEGLEKVSVNIPEGITTGLYLIEINTAKGKVSRKLFVNR